MGPAGPEPKLDAAGGSIGWDFALCPFINFEPYVLDWLDTTPRTTTSTPRWLPAPMDGHLCLGGANVAGKIPRTTTVVAAVENTGRRLRLDSHHVVEISSHKSLNSDPKVRGNPGDPRSRNILRVHH